MMKIGLCDDELDSLKYTSKIIEAQIINMNLDAEIIVITDDQELIKQKVVNHEIDVLFLDIEFKSDGKNGITFANELRTFNKDFSLIFVTAFFEYSMLAYQCKTFGYMLKPITMQSIAPIMLRLQSEFFQEPHNFIQLNKSESIRAKDILFIERNKSKTKVYTACDTFETNYSLNSMQEFLPKDFIRVHRSYIVNQNNIQGINKNEKIILFENKLSCPLGQLKSF